MDPTVEPLRTAGGRLEGIVATEPGRRTFFSRLDPLWILPPNADPSFGDAPTPAYR